MQLKTDLGIIEGEFFPPDQEANAAILTEREGSELYTITSNGEVLITLTPLPEHEILGYLVTENFGEEAQVTQHKLPIELQ